MHIKEANYRKGRTSEERARNFLEEKGFCWIESNFEVDIGEVDLIMSDEDWLVFVEVKYKSDDYMGLPEEMIGKRKMAQVRRVAEVFLLKNPKIKKIFSKYRIDAVCILGTQVNYYRNIY